VWAVLENLGYRQLTVWWRLRGIASYIRGKKSWGKMRRKGFASAAADGVPFAETIAAATMAG